MRIKMSHGLAAVALSWAVVGPTAFAQQQTPSQYDRVKGLEPFLGFWRGDAEPSAETPAGTVSALVRWTSNRSYATFRWSFHPDGGERMQVSTVIVGWDGADQHLNAWAFWLNGNGQGKASLNDGVLSYTANGATADGRKASGQVTLTVSDDEMIVVVRNIKRGDQEDPGYTITLRRRPQARRGGQ